MQKIRIFISSVQKEFEQERRLLVDYISNDLLLSRFFDAFLFEQMPANNDAPDVAYLKEVEQCDVYLGLLGEKYGFENAEGVSPTELEYDKATQLHKTRLLYIKKSNNREAKESAFIRKVQTDVVRKTFENYAELQLAVYASLLHYMDTKHIISWKPFDATTDSGATIKDIDEDKVKDFIAMAKSKRNFPLNEDVSVPVFLRHLDLMDDDGNITNAAILLFGKKPQKYFISSEVKCVQFYGNKVEKPVPSCQIYRGDVFELVNQATSFVMSRVDNWTGTRIGNTASVPTHPELPIDAVQEAIVNAICHRDYNSNGSVQVMMFKNRVEVWNPGQLPYGLSVQKLLGPHASIPANPLIATPMYWCGYIEKMGTGTEDIIRKCVDYGLPEPEFVQEEDFRTIIWRKDAVKSAVKSAVKKDSNYLKIYDLIKRDNSVTVGHIGALLKLSDRGVRKYIEKLKNDGLIKRVGATNGGHWEIIDNKC